MTPVSKLSPQHLPFTGLGAIPKFGDRSLVLAFHRFPPLPSPCQHSLSPPLPYRVPLPQAQTNPPLAKKNPLAPHTDGDEKVRGRRPQMLLPLRSRSLSTPGSSAHKARADVITEPWLCLNAGVVAGRMRTAFLARASRSELSPPLALRLASSCACLPARSALLAMLDRLPVTSIGMSVFSIAAHSPRVPMPRPG